MQGHAYLFFSRFKQTSNHSRSEPGRHVPNIRLNATTSYTVPARNCLEYDMRAGSLGVMGAPALTDIDRWFGRGRGEGGVGQVWKSQVTWSVGCWDSQVSGSRPFVCCGYSPLSGWRFSTGIRQEGELHGGRMQMGTAGYGAAEVLANHADAACPEVRLSSRNGHSTVHDGSSCGERASQPWATPLGLGLHTHR